MLTMVRACVAALRFSFDETCPTLVPCPVPCPNTERATWARRAGPSAEPSQELFQPQGLCRACVFRPLASLHILYTFQQVSHCFVVEGVVLMIHGTQLFHNVRNALSCALELVGLLFFFCCSSSLSCDLCVLSRKPASASCSCSCLSKVLVSSQSYCTNLYHIPTPSVGGSIRFSQDPFLTCQFSPATLK